MRRDILKYLMPLLVLMLGILAVITYVLPPVETPTHLSEREAVTQVPGTSEVTERGYVILPYPKFRVGNLSVEEAIAFRRSIREYTPETLTLTQLSQLLWATQGITEVRYGFRAAPSAGATYPLEVYVVIREGGVEGLPAGIYKYLPHPHVLKVVKLGDFSEELYEACLRQEWVLDAPINIVITAVYERTTSRYGERGIRYVHMEVGHAGQNVYLEATNLGLGAVVIGAFYDEAVANILSAPKEEAPLYVIPVGYPERPYRITEEALKEYIDAARETLPLD